MLYKYYLYYNMLLYCYILDIYVYICIYIHYIHILHIYNGSYYKQNNRITFKTVILKIKTIGCNKNISRYENNRTNNYNNHNKDFNNRNIDNSDNRSISGSSNSN